MAKLKGSLKIKLALGLVGNIQKRKLDKASKNAAREQEKTLRRILEYAKDSEWGKAHHFAEILAAPNAQELFKRWQEHVPATDYEDLRPFIERHKNGEKTFCSQENP